MWKQKVYFLCIWFIIHSCTLYQQKNEAILYQQAIEHAVYPTQAKQQKLTAVQSGNQQLIHKNIKGEDHILVVTWKSKNYYPAPGEMYHTGKYEIWVTIAPELYLRMKKYKSTDQAYRIKQLLGLPPTAQNSIFIEFWVRPQDLFRPCPDKEIDDDLCNCSFTAKDSVDMDHINWINQGRIDRFFASNLYQQYPWTQLGYTYDWHPKNKTHKGLSEFVIGKNKNIVVHQVYSTTEYLNKNNLY